MVHTSMGGRAEFICDTAGAALIVYVRGEIDHHTAVNIRGGIDTVLYEKRPERLILDLSAVGFMDSSGLGLIMGRLAVMRDLGGEMTVANPSREVMAIMALAGMERILRVEYTEGHEPPSFSASSTVGAIRRGGERATEDHGGRPASRQGHTTRARRVASAAHVPEEAVSSIEIVEPKAATAVKSPKAKER